MQTARWRGRSNGRPDVALPIAASASGRPTSVHAAPCRNGCTHRTSPDAHHRAADSTSANHEHCQPAWQTDGAARALARCLRVFVCSDSMVLFAPPIARAMCGAAVARAIMIDRCMVRGGWRAAGGGDNWQTERKKNTHTQRETNLFGCKAPCPFPATGTTAGDKDDHTCGKHASSMFTAI